MPSNLPGGVHPLFPAASQGGLMSPRPSMVGGSGGGGGHPLAGLDGSAMTSHALTSSSGGGAGSNHQPGQSIVVPTPQRTRTIKSYHCRMCDQVSVSTSDVMYVYM